eukprot:gene1626-995_t
MPVFSPLFRTPRARAALELYVTRCIEFSRVRSLLSVFRSTTTTPLCVVVGVGLLVFCYPFIVEKGHKRDHGLLGRLFLFIFLLTVLRLLHTRYGLRELQSRHPMRWIKRTILGPFNLGDLIDILRLRFNSVLFTSRITGYSPLFGQQSLASDRDGIYLFIFLFLLGLLDSQKVKRISSRLQLRFLEGAISLLYIYYSVFSSSFFEKREDTLLLFRINPVRTLYLRCYGLFFCYLFINIYFLSLVVRRKAARETRFHSARRKHHQLCLFVYLFLLTIVTHLFIISYRSKQIEAGNLQLIHIMSHIRPLEPPECPSSPRLHSTEEAQTVRHRSQQKQQYSSSHLLSIVTSGGSNHSSPATTPKKQENNRIVFQQRGGKPRSTPEVSKQQQRHNLAACSRSSVTRFLPIDTATPAENIIGDERSGSGTGHSSHSSPLSQMDRGGAVGSLVGSPQQQQQQRVCSSGRSPTMPGAGWVNAAGSKTQDGAGFIPMSMQGDVPHTAGSSNDGRRASCSHPSLLLLEDPVLPSNSISSSRNGSAARRPALDRAQRRGSRSRPPASGSSSSSRPSPSSPTLLTLSSPVSGIALTRPSSAAAENSSSSLSRDHGAAFGSPALQRHASASSPPPPPSTITLPSNPVVAANSTPAFNHPNGVLGPALRLVSRPGSPTSAAAGPQHLLNSPPSEKSSHPPTGDNTLTVNSLVSSRPNSGTPALALVFQHSEIPSAQGQSVSTFTTAGDSSKGNRSSAGSRGSYVLNRVASSGSIKSGAGGNGTARRSNKSLSWRHPTGSSSSSSRPYSMISNSNNSTTRPVYTLNLPLRDPSSTPQHDDGEEGGEKSHQHDTADDLLPSSASAAPFQLQHLLSLTLGACPPPMDMGNSRGSPEPQTQHEHSTPYPRRYSNHHQNNNSNNSGAEKDGVPVAPVRAGQAPSKGVSGSQQMVAKSLGIESIGSSTPGNTVLLSRGCPTTHQNSLSQSSRCPLNSGVGGVQLSCDHWFPSVSNMSFSHIPVTSNTDGRAPSPPVAGAQQQQQQQPGGLLSQTSLNSRRMGGMSAAASSTSLQGTEMRLVEGFSSEHLPFPPEPSGAMSTSNLVHNSSPVSQQGSSSLTGTNSGYATPALLKQTFQRKIQGIGRSPSTTVSASIPGNNGSAPSLPALLPRSPLSVFTQPPQDIRPGVPSRPANATTGGAAPGDASSGGSRVSSVFSSPFGSPKKQSARPGIISGASSSGGGSSSHPTTEGPAPPTENDDDDHAPHQAVPSPPLRREPRSPGVVALHAEEEQQRRTAPHASVGSSILLMVEQPRATPSCPRGKQKRSGSHLCVSVSVPPASNSKAEDRENETASPRSPGAGAGAGGRSPLCAVPPSTPSSTPSSPPRRLCPSTSTPPAAAVSGCGSGDAKSRLTDGRSNSPATPCAAQPSPSPSLSQGILRRGASACTLLTDSFLRADDDDEQTHDSREEVQVERHRGLSFDLSPAEAAPSRPSHQDSLTSDETPEGEGGGEGNGGNGLLRKDASSTEERDDARPPHSSPAVPRDVQEADSDHTLSSPLGASTGVLSNGTTPNRPSFGSSSTGSRRRRPRTASTTGTRPIFHLAVPSSSRSPPGANKKTIVEDGVGFRKPCPTPITPLTDRASISTRGTREQDPLSTTRLTPSLQPGTAGFSISGTAGRGISAVIFSKEDDGDGTDGTSTPECGTYSAHRARPRNGSCGVDLYRHQRTLSNSCKTQSNTNTTTNSSNTMIPTPSEGTSSATSSANSSTAKSRPSSRVVSPLIVSCTSGVRIATYGSTTEGLSACTGSSPSSPVVSPVVPSEATEMVWPANRRPLPAATTTSSQHSITSPTANVPRQGTKSAAPQPIPPHNGKLWGRKTAPPSTLTSGSEMLIHCRDVEVRHVVVRQSTSSSAGGEAHSSRRRSESTTPLDTLTAVATVSSALAEAREPSPPADEDGKTGQRTSRGATDVTIRVLVSAAAAALSRPSSGGSRCSEVQTCSSGEEGGSCSPPSTTSSRSRSNSKVLASTTRPSMLHSFSVDHRSSTAMPLPDMEEGDGTAVPVVHPPVSPPVTPLHPAAAEEEEQPGNEALEAPKEEEACSPDTHRSTSSTRIKPPSLDLLCHGGADDVQQPDTVITTAQDQQQEVQERRASDTAEVPQANDATQPDRNSGISKKRRHRHHSSRHRPHAPYATTASPNSRMIENMFVCSSSSSSSSSRARCSPASSPHPPVSPWGSAPHHHRHRPTPALPITVAGQQPHPLSQQQQQAQGAGALYICERHSLSSNSNSNSLLQNQFPSHQSSLDTIGQRGPGGRAGSLLAPAVPSPSTLPLRPKDSPVVSFSAGPTMVVDALHEDVAPTHRLMSLPLPADDAACSPIAPATTGGHRHRHRSGQAPSSSEPSHPSPHPCQHHRHGFPPQQGSRRGSLAPAGILIQSGHKGFTQVHHGTSSHSNVTHSTISVSTTSNTTHTTTSTNSGSRAAAVHTNSHSHTTTTLTTAPCSVMTSLASFAAGVMVVSENPSPTRHVLAGPTHTGRTSFSSNSHLMSRTPSHRSASSSAVASPLHHHSNRQQQQRHSPSRHVASAGSGSSPCLGRCRSLEEVGSTNSQPHPRSIMSTPKMPAASVELPAKDDEGKEMPKRPQTQEILLGPTAPREVPLGLIEEAPLPYVNSGAGFLGPAVSAVSSTTSFTTPVGSPVCRLPHPVSGSTTPTNSASCGGSQAQRGAAPPCVYCLAEYNFPNGIPEASQGFASFEVSRTSTLLNNNNPSSESLTSPNPQWAPPPSVTGFISSQLQPATGCTCTGCMSSLQCAATGSSGNALPQHRISSSTNNNNDSSNPVAVMADSSTEMQSFMAVPALELMSSLGGSIGAGASSTTHNNSSTMASPHRTDSFNRTTNSTNLHRIPARVHGARRHSSSSSSSSSVLLRHQKTAEHIPTSKWHTCATVVRSTSMRCRCNSSSSGRHPLPRPPSFDDEDIGSTLAARVPSSGVFSSVCCSHLGLQSFVYNSNTCGGGSRCHSSHGPAHRNVRAEDGRTDVRRVASPVERQSTARGSGATHLAPTAGSSAGNWDEDDDDDGGGGPPGSANRRHHQPHSLHPTHTMAPCAPMGTLPYEIIQQQQQLRASGHHYFTSAEDALSDALLEPSQHRSSVGGSGDMLPRSPRCTSVVDSNHTPAGEADRARESPLPWHLSCSSSFLPDRGGAGSNNSSRDSSPSGILYAGGQQHTEHGSSLASASSSNSRVVLRPPPDPRNSTSMLSSAHDRRHHLAQSGDGEGSDTSSSLPLPPQLAHYYHCHPPSSVPSVCSTAVFSASGTISSAALSRTMPSGV